MHTALKWGLAAGGAWVVLALATKAAAPPAVPGIQPDPSLKPKDPGLPKVDKPSPSDGKPVPPPPTVTPSGYLTELSQDSKAAVWKVLQQHGVVTTPRPNIVTVDPNLTTDTTQRVDVWTAFQNRDNAILILSSATSTALWAATPSELAAQDKDPANAWKLYLRAQEAAAVDAASKKIDPATLPADVAAPVADILRGWAAATG